MGRQHVIHYTLLALVHMVVQLVVQVQCTDQQCGPAKYSQYGYYLRSSAYKTLINKDLGTCYIKCYKDKLCSSINYNLANGKCEHNHVTKTGFPSRLVRNHNWVYAETNHPGYGSSQALSVSSCKRILEIHPKAASGTYWIRVGNGSTQTPPFQVYCDMTTDGGGWTLVYSYRFTNFATFNSVSNALTPIPAWPINKSYRGWVQQSKAVPIKESSYSAMDFALWKEIGTEFLVKPNITHWISCKPGTGDLVNLKPGSINCKVVKNVATKCLNSAPTELQFHARGPTLLKNGDYYIYFDGNTAHSYPAHDPCATRSITNHLTNIASPGGVMYIR